MISVGFRGQPFNITGIQVYTSTTDAKEAEVDQSYEDLEDLLELAPKKDVLFIIGDWNVQVQFDNYNIIIHVRVLLSVFL